VWCKTIIDGVMGRPLLFGVLSLRSSQALLAAGVKVVVDTDGKLGEAGAGPVADFLPNRFLIHFHMGYFA
jgi:hypothetical protein